MAQNKNLIDIKRFSKHLTLIFHQPASIEFEYIKRIYV